MKNEEVEKNLIFLGIVGSTAYGTNLDNGISDFDYSGVCIPPKEYYFGLKSFAQADKWVDENNIKIDKTIFSFDKIIDLLIENNPNILDLLFLPERCIKLTTPYWNKLLDIKEEFISKKCKFSFSGYSFSQISRIKTHKSYLLNPISKPDRKDYDLPEKSIFPDTQYRIISKISTDFLKEDKKTEFYKEITQIIDSDMSLVFKKYIKSELSNVASDMFRYGQKEYLRSLETISSKFLKDEFLNAAQNELRYLSAYENWKRYEEWKIKRNPKRAVLEAKCGFDSKHASHLIRLLRMGNEILEGKGVLVDRTRIDAEELKEIRLGNVKWDVIETESNLMFNNLDLIYKTSIIPRTPNFDLIEKTKIEIIESYLNVS